MSNKNRVPDKLLHKIFGVSAYELNVRSGIPYPQLLRWNNGVKKMDLPMLVKLCEAMHMPVGKFVSQYIEHLKEIGKL